jgi:hypothetical protein
MSKKNPFPRDPPGYSKLVRKFEAEGLTTSDAQGCADVYFRDHASFEPTCAACSDTGVIIVANAENGPEFDSESPCSCATAERLIRESNEAQDREREEFLQNQW